jgi:hypothetical protein
MYSSSCVRREKFFSLHSVAHTVPLVRRVGGFLFLAPPMEIPTAFFFSPMIPSSHRWLSLDKTVCFFLCDGGSRRRVGRWRGEEVYVPPFSLTPPPGKALLGSSFCSA